MSHATLRIIREEHAALAAVLRSILLLIAKGRLDDKGLDFVSLRAMLFYVDEFPEKRHHKKESELLFPKLRARSFLARELLSWSTITCAPTRRQPRASFGRSKLAHVQQCIGALHKRRTLNYAWPCSAVTPTA